MRLIEFKGALPAARSSRAFPWLRGMLLTLVLVPVCVPMQSAEAAAAASRPASKERIARALFTTDIVNHEPIDRVLVLSNAKERVYFFTDLRHMQGKTIIHRWIYKGKVVASVPFKVKGPRWRVYSSKQLDPHDLGKWTVVITDGNGWPLKAGIFRYVAAGGTGDNAPVILPPDVGDPND